MGKSINLNYSASKFWSSNAKNFNEETWTKWNIDELKTKGVPANFFVSEIFEVSSFSKFSNIV